MYTNPAMEQPGLHVVVDASLCDAIGGPGKRCAGLSGVVIGSTNDGCSIIQLDEESADRRYNERMETYQRDLLSIWYALRVGPMPKREETLTIFSGVLKIVEEV